MREVVEEQMQETINLISQALQDAMLDIRFIDQNKPKIAISRVRCHLLLATLRNTLTHARSLESSFRQ